MKLVSKAVINRFSGQTYSLGSMFEQMGSQPHHIAGYLRLKKQTKMGLMSLIEGLGNVYEKEPKKGMKEIESLSFTWDVETTQIPTIRFTRATVAPTNPNDPFTFYAEERFFAKYDVFILENQQQVYVTAEPEKINDTEFKYTGVYFSSLGTLDVDYMKQNDTARYIYNMHGEFSEYGTTKHFYNMERHINYMTKIRSGQSYSNDFRANEDLFFVSNNDANKIAGQVQKGSKDAGGAKIFHLSSVEQQVLDNFFTAEQGAMIHGRSTVDPTTGRPQIGVDGQDIISGDGLIPQYERYAHTINYSNSQLRLKDFQDAIENVADKRGESTNNHLTVVCNRKFSRDKAQALQDSLGAFTPSNNGAWFYTRDLKVPTDPFGGNKLKKEEGLNEITIGATFNTYVYEGNSITFVVDEALTQHYKDRGYAIFMDTGIYETENGQVPGVHMVTLKGRSLVKGYVAGMGGIDGKSNGLISNASDSGRFEVLGWRGLCVQNPMCATIVEEVI